MFLSFIVPVYNAESHVDKCINSILNQTYKEFELILIDDCSFDNSLSICQKYELKDSRVKVLKNNINYLAGKTRNIGLSIATGNYIWFVDADDWIEIDALEKLVSIVANAIYPDIVLVGYKEHLKNSEVINHVPYALQTKKTYLDDFLKISGGFFSMPFVYIFSKSFLDKKNLEFPHSCYYEDLIFIAKAIFYSKRTFIYEQILYNYNKTNSNSITVNSTQKKIIDLLNMYRLITDFMIKKGVKKSLHNLLTFRFIVFGISRCFKMFYELSFEDKVNTELKSIILYYAHSENLKNENLNKLITFSKTLEGTDKYIRSEYIKGIQKLRYYKELIIKEQVNNKI